MLDFEEKLNMHFYKEYGGISSWVGDGFCDDINNNKACGYDDGDCCGWESMKKNFCVQCICKGKPNSFNTQYTQCAPIGIGENPRFEI